MSRVLFTWCSECRVTRPPRPSHSPYSWWVETNLDSGVYGDTVGNIVAAPQQQVEHGDHGAELLHPALLWAEIRTLHTAAPPSFITV